ncbi:hypothetical protein C2I17_07830 [Niallia circulans]|jgi:hypothetical protein|nr:hypothetical protein C2I17_07830 [Niallia circulans]
MKEMIAINWALLSNMGKLSGAHSLCGCGGNGVVSLSNCLFYRFISDFLVFFLRLIEFYTQIECRGSEFG